MRSARRLAAVALAAGLAAAGCGAGEPGGGAAGEHEAEGRWELVSGRGSRGVVQVPDGARITLFLAGGEADGTAACNHYGGAVTLDGSRFALGEISMTEIGCAPDLARAEAAYVAALQEVDTVRVDGERLVLSGRAAELTFAPVPPVPTAALVGTEWRIETLIDGETAASVTGAPTLLLTASGAIEGTTGCRRFTGRYVEQGDEVIVTALAAEPSRGACPDEDPMQDEIVLDVVGDRFQASVEGELLRLTAGGRGLICRAG